MPERKRHGFTTRAVVLAIALCAVLLTLAVPLQQYVAQRGQLAGLSAEERAAKERVAALEKAQAEWQDPAFIKQQARERLHFVKPGETAYVLVDPNAPSTATAAPSPSPAHASDKGAWYDRLWGTVQTAGATPTPSPSPRPQRQSPGPLGPSPRAH
jgi:cell division protein FtsB